MPDETERFWKSTISRFQYTLNFGFICDFYVSALLVYALVTVPLILWFRSMDMALFEVGLVLGFGLILLVVVSYWRGKRLFFTATAARVDLEYRLKLRNALTAAAEGVTPWPAQRAIPEDLIRWNWKALVPVPTVSLAILCLAIFVPLPENQASSYGVIEKPPTLQRLEDWVEQLKMEQLVDEEALERVDEQVSDLSGRGQDEWYKHTTLEAIDRLEEQTRTSLQRLSAGLESATQALSDAGALEAGAGDSEWEKVADSMREAADEMSFGGLPLDEGLLKSLSALDENAFKQMDPKQLSKLKEMTKCGMQACQSVLGEGDALPVIGLSEGEGDEQQCAGMGGINRGPGEAPLALKPEVNNLGSETVENIENDDMRQAVLGQALGVTQDEHETDANQQMIQTGGSTGNQGSGGASVWNETLGPEEQDMVRRYFQ
ncbi:MAG: hypothetical protein AAF571_01785 [Verrucomicrobiota bacterium]